MALTQSEITKRYRDKKKQDNCMRVDFWADAELSRMLEKAIADKPNLSKKEALQAILFESLQSITCNDVIENENNELKLKVDSLQAKVVALEKSIAGNQEIITDYDKILSENKQLTSENDKLIGRIYQLEKIVAGQLQSITGNDLIVSETLDLKVEKDSLKAKSTESEKMITANRKNITGNDKNDKSPTKNLSFNLVESKKIATELKAQGLTGNQIAAELARRGYGNKYGKPFSKSSVNKWKL